ncbi:hypothetical protein L6164_037247 [Bauhinia variegata]|uniref:Uncharacterized protein n=1 Tax=Bauhinia variegata TaxID=167791 RepID=A0ACB9KJK6_BAUVA|nr:hypothetical protein L6164_037247 [Bauhinia variegata]
MECLQSVSMKVLWNGAQIEEFKAGRGVRQGDLIPPYIFVTCMDKLSHLIAERVGLGCWEPMRAGRNDPLISHLMFADVFCFLQKLVNNILIRLNNAFTSSAGAQGKKISSEKVSGSSRDFEHEKVLKGKYGRNQEWVYNIDVRSTDSHIWQAVGQIWGKLTGNHGWTLGNGKNSRFWTEARLGEGGTIIDSVDFRVPDYLMEDRVAEKWRYDAVFEDSFTRPSNPMRVIISFSKNIKQAMQSAGGVKHGEGSGTLSWSKPPSHWIKVNTDGASKGNPDIDECSTIKPCNNWTCINLVGGYNYSCPPGYKGDGKRDGSGCVLELKSKKNVVVGIALETEAPILVYEFVPNGHLFESIDPTKNVPALPWETRLLAAEIAETILYLHSAASVPIIYRDIRSTNILLDNNNKAIVSDFGASRLVPQDETQVSSIVQGTPRYLDPEYLQTSELNEKSDVCSFGVVLI